MSARSHMLTAIDHIVILVPDLPDATDRYRQLGFVVVPGGRHTTNGTHNALIGLSDGSYIELLSFYEPTPASPWWGLSRHGSQLVDFCAQTDSLSDDVAAFRAAGIAMGDPRPMGRVRPDGYQLEWVLSLPPDNLRGVVPFLIEDRTPRRERAPQEASHPNQVTGIESVALAVDDVEATSALFQSILRTDGHAVERSESGEAGRRFAVGPHALEVLAAMGSSTRLRARLARPESAGAHARGQRQLEEWTVGLAFNA